MWCFAIVVRGMFVVLCLFYKDKQKSSLIRRYIYMLIYKYEKIYTRASCTMLLLIEDTSKAVSFAVFIQIFFAHERSCPISGCSLHERSARRVGRLPRLVRSQQSVTGEAIGLPLRARWRRTCRRRAG